MARAQRTTREAAVRAPAVTAARRLVVGPLAGKARPPAPERTAPKGVAAAHGLHLPISAPLDPRAGVVQRAVIPVYRRSGSAAELATDKTQVDQFAENSALAANSGTVRSDLATGGDLSGIAVPEDVIVTGHGNVGTLQGYSGSEVATFLKGTWRLPKPYAGTIRLSSCKAGDTGWIAVLSPSLVASVSDSLHGYSAVVEGMKGNVVTGGAVNARPGLMRSVGSDQAFADYKTLTGQYTDAVKAKEDDFRATAKAYLDERYLADMTIKTSELVEGARAFDKRSSSWSLTSMASSITSSLHEAVTGSGGEKAKEEAAKIAAARVTIQKCDVEINRIRLAMDQKHNPTIQGILQRMDALGQPLGTAAVTVRHGPADRKTLVNQFIAFVDEEIEKGSRAPAQSSLLPI